MYVRVDLGETPATVVVAEPDDLGRLHVQVAAEGLVHGGEPAEGVRDHLRAVLDESGVGRLAPGGGEVWLDISGLHSRAAAAAAASAGEWEEGFAKMIDYARSKGWISDDSLSVQAHLQWEG